MLRVCCCFFFKQKTAYEMRISDWSSDVCSSDLPGLVGTGAAAEARHADFPKRGRSSCGLTACTEGRGRCPFTNPGCSAAHDLVSSVRKPGKRGVCAAIFAVVFGVSAMVAYTHR